MFTPIRKYSPEITRIKIWAWCDKAERCHWDVRRKLMDWGVPNTEREQLSALLIENNLLNEARYASAFAHDKFEFNHWGSKKIEQQLKLKGVSEHNIKNALKNIDPTDVSESIAALIKKKEPQFKGLQLYQKKIKIARFLYSKGHGQDIVWREIEKYFI